MVAGKATSISRESSSAPRLEPTLVAWRESTIIAAGRQDSASGAAKLILSAAQILVLEVSWIFLPLRLVLGPGLGLPKNQ